MAGRICDFLHKVMKMTLALSPCPAKKFGSMLRVFFRGSS